MQQTIWTDTKANIYYYFLPRNELLAPPLWTHHCRFASRTELTRLTQQTCSRDSEIVWRNHRNVKTHTLSTVDNLFGLDQPSDTTSTDRYHPSKLHKLYCTPSTTRKKIKASTPRQTATVFHNYFQPPKNADRFEPIATSEQAIPDKSMNECQLDKFGVLIWTSVQLNKVRNLQ